MTITNGDSRSSLAERRGKDAKQRKDPGLECSSLCNPTCKTDTDVRSASGLSPVYAIECSAKSRRVILEIIPFLMYLHVEMSHKTESDVCSSALM
jgi:hypothetical protein